MIDNIKNGLTNIGEQVGELLQYISELEKEKAELKYQNKIILEDNDTLNKWIDEQKEENAKLKERVEKLELLTEQYDKLCWKLDAMLEKLEGKQ